MAGWWPTLSSLKRGALLHIPAISRITGTRLSPAPGPVRHGPMAVHSTAAITNISPHQEPVTIQQHGPLPLPRPATIMCTPAGASTPTGQRMPRTPSPTMAGAPRLRSVSRSGADSGTTWGISILPRAPIIPSPFQMIPPISLVRHISSPTQFSSLPGVRHPILILPLIITMLPL